MPAARDTIRSTSIFLGVMTLSLTPLGSDDEPLLVAYLVSAVVVVVVVVVVVIVIVIVIVIATCCCPHNSTCTSHPSTATRLLKAFHENVSSYSFVLAWPQSGGCCTAAAAGSLQYCPPRTAMSAEQGATLTQQVQPLTQ